MKSEGWLYLQLAASYEEYSTLEAAFPVFVGRWRSSCAAKSVST